jgi:hypothetical protein
VRYSDIDGAVARSVYSPLRRVDDGFVVVDKFAEQSERFGLRESFETDITELDLERVALWWSVVGTARSRNTSRRTLRGADPRSRRFVHAVRRVLSLLPEPAINALQAETCAVSVGATGWLTG